MSDIEWTDEVWNPVVGCSRVSAGCQHCYAERVAHRGMSPQHRGLTVMGANGPRWTGEVRMLAERLGEPLRWRKPRKVFVNSMSDLFHEDVSFEFIAAVFGVMAAAPQHTFQVLTKRPARMREFFAWLNPGARFLAFPPTPIDKLACYGVQWVAKSAHMSHADLSRAFAPGRGAKTWPLPNVWLGVSVEDQATADERIPLLLECPAAVRWVSYEPALGPVNFRALPFGPREPRSRILDALTAGSKSATPWHLDWIVVGGESGPGARPFDIEWARSAVQQCREAGVKAFVKQLGALPHETHRLDDQVSEVRILDLRDRKGGDMAEWPVDLRVREWPEVRG